ncbi:MAG: heavy-metal-associated domain-containing protein [Chloroflexota bacterium]
MEKKTFVVPNMGCDGCVKTIENEVVEIDGVVSVYGLLDSKEVTVEWDSPATWDNIKIALVNIDYPPAEAAQ